MRVRAGMWCLGIGLATLFALGMVVMRLHPAIGSMSEVRSSELARDQFINPAPVWQDTLRGLSRQFVPTADGAPTNQLFLPDISPIGEAPLRITWFGHSSVAIEMDELRLIVDPIIGERASPFSFIGPKAFYDRGPSADYLLMADVVLISHDHYDHLDFTAIRALRSSSATFIVPLGVGRHLQRWGIAHQRITELDWWAQAKIGPVTVTATPARHGSGRVSPFSSRTLWAGFSIAGKTHKVWYSGDTGWQEPEFIEIGQRLGPFDLTLIDAGQYDSAWPDWHLSPELAVEAHRLVRGEFLLPVHWGRYQLAHHGWTEPAERAKMAAKCRAVDLVVPAPGQPIGYPFQVQRQWWPDAKWLNATESPIRPTREGNPHDRIDWRCQ